MPCALVVLGPIWVLLGIARTDWYLCSFLFSSWISSSFSDKRFSRSLILSSFSMRILAKSSSRSLIVLAKLSSSHTIPGHKKKKKEEAFLEGACCW
ncbi:hypothetical protein GDO78_008208 [Eleutherodactylus coqui]|uniref:Uncharacterized protein n=1 Tax=Eleutherodactylus coqui TaxID=57060 RepID=A0A8J6FBH3_ELECQ|nr:hypothetical protein GDO78_008208 [Eleutherodactylus coqui]